MRRLAIAGGLLAVTVWAGGCATAPAPAAPRPGSPEALCAGPSLHETGRFGVVPMSNGGIRIEEAGTRPAPAEQPAAKPRLATGGHKARASSDGTTKRHGRRRPSQAH